MTDPTRRGWTGPAIFSYGFRPFFLFGAVWAALAMLIWIGMLTGQVALPTTFDPVSWHAHEFLFGYLGAVIAGFLTTAVPNWTGRPVINGWPLAGLVALWLAGRVAVACSAHLGPVLAAAVDLSFTVVLAIAIGRDIVAARNWRNLMVAGILGLFAIANGLFHWQAFTGDYAAQGGGLRLGLAAAIMLIAVIGGRIVPAFTRNWLMMQRIRTLPAPPMQPFDWLALATLLAALVCWIAAPGAVVSGVALMVAGGLHLARLARWQGARAGAEPLVWVLHAGFAFVPLGALAVGAGSLWPGIVPPAVAQHLWMAGAIGLMTLAVMTRVTRGHTGQDLHAGTGTLVLYLALIGAVLARVLAGLLPVWASEFHVLAAACWVVAFGGFGGLYGPLLLRSRAPR